jgi:hypothetical protein
VSRHDRSRDAQELGAFSSGVPLAGPLSYKSLGTQGAYTPMVSHRSVSFGVSQSRPCARNAVDKHRIESALCASSCGSFEKR